MVFSCLPLCWGGIKGHLGSIISHFHFQIQVSPRYCRNDLKVAFVGNITKYVLIGHRTQTDCQPHLQNIKKYSTSTTLVIPKEEISTVKLRLKVPKCLGKQTVGRKCDIQYAAMHTKLDVQLSSWYPPSLARSANTRRNTSVCVVFEKLGFFFLL